MDFVDEEDGAFLFLQFGQEHFQALLEIAAILGAGQERAQVQREDAAFGHHVRHFAIDDALGEAFGDGGLADAGFADQQRIVLAPPAEHLDDPFHFVVAPHQWVDLAGLGEFVEIAGEGFQRWLAAAFALLGRGRLAGGAGPLAGGL